jgi:hypothetical protein
MTLFWVGTPSPSNGSLASPFSRVPSSTSVISSEPIFCPSLAARKLAPGARAPVDRAQDPAEQGPGDVRGKDDRGLLGLDRSRVEHLHGVLDGLGGDLLGRLEVGEEAAAAAFAPRRLCSPFSATTETPCRSPPRS